MYNFPRFHTTIQTLSNANTHVGFIEELCALFHPESYGSHQKMALGVRITLHQARGQK